MCQSCVLQQINILVMKYSLFRKCSGFWHHRSIFSFYGKLTKFWCKHKPKYFKLKSHSSKIAKIYAQQKQAAEPNRNKISLMHFFLIFRYYGTCHSSCLHWQWWFLASTTVKVPRIHVTIYNSFFNETVVLYYVLIAKDSKII